MERHVSVHLHDSSWSEYDDPRPLDSLPSVTVGCADSSLLSSVIDQALASISAKHFAPAEAVRRGYYLTFATPEHEPSVAAQWRFQQDYYGVDATGRLFIDDVQLKRMTVGDLARSGRAGYLVGAWDRIVVMRPEGLGGGSPVVDLVAQFVDFLDKVGFELAVGTASTQLGRVAERINTVRGDVRVRKIIRSWDDRGIDRPWEIRRWIDMKTRWDAAEVAKRLRIERTEAESLLRALGFDFEARLDSWTVGTTEKARKRRKKWERAE